MTANIQQIGANRIGSFAVEPSSGEAYPGIVFEDVEEDRIRANHLTVKDAGESKPRIFTTFTGACIVDHETIKGNFLYPGQGDKGPIALSGPYEAIRNEDYACP